MSAPPREPPPHLLGPDPPTPHQAQENLLCLLQSVGARGGVFFLILCTHHLWGGAEGQQTKGLVSMLQSWPAGKIFLWVWPLVWAPSLSLAWQRWEAGGREGAQESPLGAGAE